MAKELDPDAPLVGEDGLEYANFADYLCGKPVNCRRNDEIRGLRAEVRRWRKAACSAAVAGFLERFDPQSEEAWGRLVVSYYRYRNRNSDHYVFANAISEDSIARPQFWEGPGKARCDAKEAAQRVPGYLDPGAGSHRPLR